jgi:hypothetical protein
VPALTMNAAFWLAGTAAAGAVTDIHRGERLAPLLGHIDRFGDVSLARVTGRPVRFAELMSQRYQVDHREAMRLGSEQLDANVSCAHGAVFVTDHVLDVESRAMPVLLLDIRAYTAPSAACTMVIPYRASSSPLGFGTHRPTVIESSRVGSDELECLMGSFFAGLENHQTGWKIWRASVVRELDTFYAV